MIDGWGEEDTHAVVVLVEMSIDSGPDFLRLQSIYLFGGIVPFS